MSGGMDSMALLHALHALGYPITAGHVEHGLRGDASVADQELVRAWCADHRVPFTACTVDPKALTEKAGVSVQMAARELRYQGLQRMADASGIGTIVTAHHRDDAIETLLIHLLRGSGPQGWASIPRRSGRVVRPLLDVGRSEIMGYAERMHIPFREDASNSDPHYLRNRVRHELLPLMEDLRPGARSALGHALERLRDLASWWMSDAPERLPQVIPFDRLNGDHGPPQMVLSKLLRPLGLHPNVVKDILLAVDRRRTGACFQKDAHAVWVDRTALRIAPLDADLGVPITIGSDLYLPDSAPIVLCEDERYGGEDRRSASRTVVIDRDRLTFPLVLRQWRPGDRMRPEGLGGSRLISDILIDAKVPRDEKTRTWVLLAGERIIWLVGHRLAEGVRAVPGATNIVRASLR
ncbi:MAG: tRNA lysidine(34) synthetase TilS [Flavobacteriales bacterium]|nr:tRNA lysidine(34) synthetase TilS [Flavobacteriales bacterium]